MNRNIEKFLGELNSDSFTSDQLSDYAADLVRLVQSNKIMIIVSVAVGLLICFFGLKLVKLWSGVYGLAVGAVLGMAASLLIGLAGISFLLVILFAGILMLVLSIIFRRLGMFWVCLFAGSSIGVLVAYISPLAGLITALTVGVLVAILGAIIRDPIVIIMTSIHGGMAAGMAVVSLFAGESYLIGGVVGILLTVFGLVVQFMTKSREIGKKQTVWAKTVKEEQSRESEVEAARSIFEADDEDDEDE